MHSWSVLYVVVVVAFFRVSSAVGIFNNLLTDAIHALHDRIELHLYPRVWLRLAFRFSFAFVELKCFRCYDYYYYWRYASLLKPSRHFSWTTFFVAATMNGYLQTIRTVLVACCQPTFCEKKKQHTNTHISFSISFDAHFLAFFRLLCAICDAALFLSFCLIFLWSQLFRLSKLSTFHALFEFFLPSCIFKLVRVFCFAFGENNLLTFLQNLTVFSFSLFWFFFFFFGSVRWVAAQR